jgi:hypothetical protein
MPSTEDSPTEEYRDLDAIGHVSRAEAWLVVAEQYFEREVQPGASSVLLTEVQTMAALSLAHSNLAVALGGLPAPAAGSDAE